MKRICSLFLSVILFCVLVALPVTASATSLSDLKFTLNSDGKSYSVEAQNRSVTGALVIPATFGGYPVTKIADSGFSGCDYSSITIPESVTSIGNSAFEACFSLTSIKIPSKVTIIDWFTFENCSNLMSVEIPDGVTVIDNSAFSGCINLSSVLFPDSVETIGEYAFSGCVSLKTVSLPDGIERVEDGLFGGCTKLKSVILPESVRVIGKYAFSGCSNLSSVTMPDTLTVIGFEAFNRCEKLVDFTVPRDVEYIYGSAFSGCKNLFSIILPSNLKEIGDQAFYDCINLKNTYFTGDEVEWNKITIGGYNDNLYTNVVFNYVPSEPMSTQLITNLYTENIIETEGVSSQSDTISEVETQIENNETDDNYSDENEKTDPIPLGIVLKVVAVNTIVIALIGVIIIVIKKNKIKND